MRHVSISSDPKTEHVFRPSELVQLLGPCERMRLPIGFICEVGEARSLTGLMDTVTSWLRDIVKADRASVVLLGDDDMLQIWSLRGRTASSLDKSLPRNYGRLGYVISEQVLVISPELSHCTEADRVMLYKSGINRIVNAPLIFNGRCFGSLNAGVVDSASIDLFYAALVQSVANWIAPALAAFSSAGAVAEDVEEARARTSQAQSESAMKSSFIANVSHEIRTPLNAMIGMAQILGNDDLTDAQAEKVSIILQSGQSLITTLNDILDLSKIEAGKLSLTLLRNHPAECFTRAVNLWRDRAAQKGLTLALTLADGLPDTLVYDADRVQQCLSNLLSNAIKFSEHGVIDVRVSAAPMGDAVTIHVEVEDRGCGIAAQSLSTIFEPFEQVGPALAAEETGTGLGLAICRRLARMMDGDVTVQSSVGQGSTFTLGFQAGRAPAVDGAIDATSGQATVIPPTELLRGRKLLLVEDVATNRVVVKLLLKKYALEVTEAENGRDALDCLGREAFDLVLLDMQMPVMDGAETIRHIRASDQPFQTVPVIALTASAMVGDRERFLRMGIDGYIPKPVDESSLVSEIADILCRTAF